MPDGDETLNVILDAVDAEAGKWRRLAQDMAVVKADASRLDLRMIDFFFEDIVSAASHSATYNVFHEWFVKLLGDASVEFNEIAVALEKSAKAYANADTRASVDLKSIYGTKPE